MLKILFMRCSFMNKTLNSARLHILFHSLMWCLLCRRRRRRRRRLTEETYSYTEYCGTLLHTVQSNFLIKDAFHLSFDQGI